MEVSIISESKDSLDIEMDNLTVAEVLRDYLNRSGAKMAAWKRDHPTKNPILRIEGDNPKKILKVAISNIEKDLDNLVADFKKLK